MKRSSLTSRSDKTPRSASGRFGLLIVGRGALWLFSAFAVVFGLHTLDARARDLQSRDPVRLEWLRLPDWLLAPEQRDLIDEISAQAGLYGDEDLAAPDVCARVASNLAASPWVERVNRVSKQPGLVRVDADIRKPLTMVEHAGTAYLIDDKGVRLPPSLRASELDRDAWLTITGASSPPPPVGELWPGQDLAAGVKLVRLINDRSSAGLLASRADLRRVDVSNFGKRFVRDGQLRIETSAPACIIHWGMPPGEEYNIESPAERKLAMLDQYWRYKGGRLGDDGPIDLRDPNGRIARPAAETGERRGLP